MNFVFIGGAKDGKMVDVTHGYDVWCIAAPSGINVHCAITDGAPFDPLLPAYEKQTYTKRSCFRGTHGRLEESYYFALASMADEEALGRYLELP